MYYVPKELLYEVDLSSVHATYFSSIIDIYIVVFKLSYKTHHVSLHDIIPQKHILNNPVWRIPPNKEVVNYKHTGIDYWGNETWS